jgi:hypothetical protein
MLNLALHQALKCIFFADDRYIYPNAHGAKPERNPLFQALFRIGMQFRILPRLRIGAAIAATLLEAH